jgi:hypothetical protein
MIISNGIIGCDSDYFFEGFLGLQNISLIEVGVPKN